MKWWVMTLRQRKYLLRGETEKFESIRWEILGYKNAKLVCNKAQKTPGKDGE